MLLDSKLRVATIVILLVAILFPATNQSAPRDVLITGAQEPGRVGMTYQTQKRASEVKQEAKRVTNRRVGTIRTPTPTRRGSNRLGPSPIQGLGDALSLMPYTGPFGEQEARVLFDRFGFGAPPERIEEAVRDGLDATITKLTTWQREDAQGTYRYNLDEIEFDLICDSWLKGNPQDNPNACNRNDPYDFHRQYFGISKMVKFLHSPNQYFYKLLFFLHDERMAGSDKVGDNFFYRYIYRQHWNMLINGARSGDYVQFMRDWMGDTMGHIIWLDGEDNLALHPNENFAREFWEFGTVGTTDLTGKQVYADADVAQAALVYTGWRREQANDAIGPYQYGAFHPEDHANGSFVIFKGSPYEAVVSMPEDLLQATFRHPRTAEHLAEDIWKEFINPYADATAIRELALIIRDSGYNLHPVMKRIMQSRALYAEASRESLIKHPMELVIGFLRSFPGYTPDHILGRTAFSRDDYEAIYLYTSFLGEALLSPNTVFGWDEKALAGESYIKRWRDVVNQMVHERYGSYSRFFELYDLEQHLLNGISTTDQLIDRVSRWFNVPLSASQRDLLRNYLDSRPLLCTAGTQSEAACRRGNKIFLMASPFFSSPPDLKERLKGLLAIIINQPSYRTK